MKKTLTNYILLVCGILLFCIGIGLVIVDNQHYDTYKWYEYAAYVSNSIMLTAVGLYTINKNL